MSVSKSISTLRRWAAKLDYYLVKARSIRWEGDQYTDPYRLFDCRTGFLVAGFYDLEEVEGWLREALTE